jgi:hypothetical protein
MNIKLLRKEIDISLDKAEKIGKQVLRYKEEFIELEKKGKIQESKEVLNKMAEENAKHKCLLYEIEQLNNLIHVKATRNLEQKCTFFSSGNCICLPLRSHH